MASQRSPEAQGLPSNWAEYLDHFIIYLRHAPTVWPEDKTYEAIYRNLIGVFPYLGDGFYEAFEQHLKRLSEETKNGKLVLPEIEKRKYWWAFDPENSPFIRRNPRRGARDRPWRGKGA